MNKRWSVLLVAFLALSINYGLRNSFGLLVDPLDTEFGLSRSIVSSILTVQMLVYAVGAPFAGYAVEKFGAQAVIGGGAVLAGAVFVVTGYTQEFWQLALIYAVFFGLASNAIGQVPCTAMISGAFQERRAAALGIMGMGTGIGSLVINPVLGHLIASMGWRSGVRIMGVIAWLLLLVPLLIVGHGVRARVTQPKPQGREVRIILKQGSFWLLFASFAALSAPVYVALSQEVAYATDLGIDYRVAAGALGLITGINLVGAPLFGWLAEHFQDSRYSGVIAYSLGIVGMLILLMQPRNYLAFYLASVLIGLAYSGYVPVLPTLAAQWVHTEAEGLTWGLLTTGGAIGAAFGPWLGGYIYDLTQAYSLAWILGMAMFALAIVLLFLLNFTPARATRLAAKVRG